MAGTVDVTTPSDRAIQVTRTFDAPAQLVFEFHTTPELVSRWLLGPPGWSMPVCDIDLTVDGRYRYVWRSEENGSEFGVGGRFQEISAPTRLVTVEQMDGAPGEALCTLTFAEKDGRTTLTTLMQFDSPALRDAALQSGMTDGMSMSYDRLEENLKRRAPSRT